MKEAPHKEYFEGILQIRGGTEELLTWIRKQIKKDQRSTVTKEKRLKTGVDMYLSDQHYLQSLGKKIKAHFPGILTVSQKLHTLHRVTSKALYRVTVLFRPLSVKKGDIVTVRGEKVEILRIAKRAQVKEVDSGKKKEIDLKLLL